jgi:hypothetical protein
MRVVFVFLIYIALTVATAFASPWFPTLALPMIVWILSTVLLFTAFVVLLNGSFQESSPLLRITGRVLISGVVTAMIAFLGFVVMVNIWEHLGLGH